MNLEKLNEHLNDKYRFVILDDETFQEKSSLRVTRVNIYAAIVSIFVLIFTFSFLLVFYTPIKYTIPGYGNEKTRATLLRLESETDSLKNVVEKRNIYLQNLKKVLTGQEDTSLSGLVSNQVAFEMDSMAVPDFSSNQVSGSRNTVQVGGANNMASSSENRKFERKSLKELHFFKPVDGYITAAFDRRNDHFGLDLGASEDSPIKSVLEGTVVSSDWTIKTGHVIAVQHDNNMIPLYKHNSKLLKKTGDKVVAGEVIAIIGNSGELTTGPHLHFELWYDGEPIDPKEYIKF